MTDQELKTIKDFMEMVAEIGRLKGRLEVYEAREKTGAIAKHMDNMIADHKEIVDRKNAEIDLWKGRLKNIIHLAKGYVVEHPGVDHNYMGTVEAALEASS